MKQINIQKIDFFSLYRANFLKKSLFSGSIAVFLAFSIVSFSNSDINTVGLMANVNNTVDATRYDADLIVKRNINVLTATFGAKAQKVDKIEFTLLSDPTRFHSLNTTSNDIVILGQKELGAYHVSIDMHGKDIVPGIEIATLMIDLDSGVPIVISDAEFLSNGQRYSITNKSE